MAGGTIDLDEIAMPEILGPRQIGLTRSPTVRPPLAAPVRLAALRNDCYSRPFVTGLSQSSAILGGNQKSRGRHRHNGGSIVERYGHAAPASHRGRRRPHVALAGNRSFGSHW